jgi:hypothetical protein
MAEKIQLLFWKSPHPTVGQAFGPTLPGRWPSVRPSAPPSSGRYTVFSSKEARESFPSPPIPTSCSILPPHAPLSLLSPHSLPLLEIQSTKFLLDGTVPASNPYHIIILNTNLIMFY